MLELGNGQDKLRGASKGHDNQCMLHKLTRIWDNEFSQGSR